MGLCYAYRDAAVAETATPVRSAIREGQLSSARATASRVFCYDGEQHLGRLAGTVRALLPIVSPDQVRGSSQ